MLGRLAGGGVFGYHNPYTHRGNMRVVVEVVLQHTLAARPVLTCGPQM
jgi:hypothetical protein